MSQFGQLFCERCKASLAWWSHSVVWGSSGKSKNRPNDYGGVCKNCKDGFCKKHAPSGLCPKCGSNLE